MLLVFWGFRSRRVQLDVRQCPRFNGLSVYHSTKKGWAKMACWSWITNCKSPKVNYIATTYGWCWSGETMGSGGKQYAELCIMHGMMWLKLMCVLFIDWVLSLPSNIVNIGREQVSKQSDACQFLSSLLLGTGTIQYTYCWWLKSCTSW